MNSISLVIQNSYSSKVKCAVNDTSNDKELPMVGPYGELG